MNYLASPPLVVAYALAGTMDIDLGDRAARHGRRRRAGLPARHLAVQRTRSPRPSREARAVADMFREQLRRGLRRRRALARADGADRRALRVGRESTYVKRSRRTSRACRRSRRRSRDIAGARVLAVLGDSVTTDHISPAGSIKRDSPAGALPASSTASSRAEFNSYGARRGNHEVMMRGTFANIRLRNLLGAAATEGGFTRHLPDGEADVDLRRRDALQRRRACRWSCSPARSTAPAPRATGRPRARCLLGVRAVIAESFERIHRSNLVGMGVAAAAVPADGESAASLGLSGEESISIEGIAAAPTAARGRAPRRAPTVAPSGRSSRRACASTPRWRPSTSATAASSSTCCVSCWPADRRPRATR